MGRGIGSDVLPAERHGSDLSHVGARRAPGVVTSGLVVMNGQHVT